MALEREDGVLGAHPAAVIDDQELAVRGIDDDSARTRVNRIIYKLTDDRRRPFDDLTGGDLVDDGRWKNRDPGRHL